MGFCDCHPPKSANLSSPFLLIRRFCGLRSRWRTFRLWQKANPRSNCSIKLRQTLISMSPFRLSKYFFRSWSQCSKTSVSLRSECRTSYNRTMFLCFNSYSRKSKEQEWPKIYTNERLEDGQKTVLSKIPLGDRSLSKLNWELLRHPRPAEHVSEPQSPWSRDCVLWRQCHRCPRRSSPASHTSASCCRNRSKILFLAKKSSPLLYCLPFLVLLFYKKTENKNHFYFQ